MSVVLFHAKHTFYSTFTFMPDAFAKTTCTAFKVYILSVNAFMPEENHPIYTN